jgi:hypothetical protein
MFQYSILYPSIDWETVMQVLNRPLKNKRRSFNFLAGFRVLPSYGIDFRIALCDVQ